MTLAVSTPAPVRRTRTRAAVLACIGRFGLAKTTLDDIAREAGCSAPRSTGTSTASPRSCARGGRRARAHRRRRGRSRARRRHLRRRGRGRGRRRRAASCAATTPSVPPRPRARMQCSSTWPSARATVSSSQSATRSRRRSTAGSRPTTRIRAGDWLARIVRSYVLMPHPPVDFTDPTAALALPRSTVS